MQKVDLALLKKTFSYDPNTGQLIRIYSPLKHRIGKVVGTVGSNGYLVVGFAGKRYRAHQIAWAIHYGTWPSHEIDHIDGDPANNRMSNLRNVSHKINLHNQSKPQGPNPYLGVHQTKTGRWRASIKVNGRVIHIGMYDTPEEARDAYLLKKKHLHLSVPETALKAISVSDISDAIPVGKTRAGITD